MLGIVANPVSGGGMGKAAAEAVKEIAESDEEQARIYLSEAKDGIAGQCAKAIQDGCSGIACIGGDGTLSEAVREIAGKPVRLYIVPAGTGNDFARCLRLPKDPLEAFRAQWKGREKRIDCGKLNGKPFINVSGSGFDVKVLERTEELKQQYPGDKAYRKAVMDVIRNYQSFSPEIEIDGRPLERGKYTIVEVANGQYIGGGMRVAPDADPEDSRFDVILVRTVPKGCIPLLLPLFILGMHTKLPLAKRIKATMVTIRSPGMTVNIDGRLEKMDEARFEIMPRGIRWMCPAGTK